MPWVRFDFNPVLRGKIANAARFCRVSKPQMLGHMICLWHWAAVHQPDGFMAGYSNEQLANVAEWTGDEIDFSFALIDDYGPHEGLLEGADWKISGWGKEVVVSHSRPRKSISSIRPSILRRDGYKCRNCAEPGYRGPAPDGLHIDHIVPVSRGGTDEESNLQLLCPPCNLNKGTMTQEEWECSGRAQQMRIQNEINNRRRDELMERFSLGVQLPDRGNR